MRRRIILGASLVVVLSCAVLPLADLVRASRPSGRVPNLLGTWDGFFQEAGGRGAPGIVRSNITRQAHRRIAGDGVLLDLQGREVTRYSFSGTVVRNEFVTGTGRTPTGRVAFHAQLETFAGGKGDAGVLHPQFLFVPARGRATRIRSTLLHPFPDVNAPDIAGSGMGTFRSLIDPRFRGDLAVEISPRDRGSFAGQVNYLPQQVMPSGIPPFSWPLRATTSDAGRFVMIAQGGTGRFVADGVALPGGSGEAPTFVGGFSRLLLNDGRRDFNAYNFNIVAPLR